MYVKALGNAIGLHWFEGSNHGSDGLGGKKTVC